MKFHKRVKGPSIELVHYNRTFLVSLAWTLQLELDVVSVDPETLR
jgi:hypothetical protein